MQFEYEITSDVFVASQLLNYKLSRGPKRIRNAISWTLPGLILIGVAWAERSADPDPLAFILPAIISAGFLYMAYVSFFPARYFRHAYLKSELAGKRFQADINEDGFEVVGDLNSWRVRWKGVRLKGEDERVFILSSAGTLFMFGKKFLNNEHQEELRRLSGLT